MIRPGMFVMIEGEHWLLGTEAWRGKIGRVEKVWSVTAWVLVERGRVTLALTNLTPVHPLVALAKVVE